jgi:hypothetical protein
LSSLGEEVSIADIDARTRLQQETILLLALITYERLDSPGLDGFMALARNTADELLRKKFGE